MNRSFSILAILAILSIPAMPQGNPGTKDISATSITLNLSNPPQPVFSSGISAQRLDNPGSCSYYYWVVANFVIGNAGPAGPAAITNGTCSLSSGNRVNWATVPGASSYDVLVTSTPAPPQGSCGCAVATGNTSATVTDTGTRNAYTVTTFNPAAFNFVVDNEQTASGQSLLNFRVNGTSVFSVNSSTGAAFNLPATVVQTNQANSYTAGAQNFGNAASLSVPQGGGLQPTCQGCIAFDFTAVRLGYGDASVYHLVVAPDTTDTFTHKTFDTGGAGNVFKIGGTQITSNQGNTSKNQLASSFGNGDFFSADVNGNTVDSGKVVPTGAVVGTSDTQTLTNKTLTSPAITNPSTTGTDSGVETLQNKTLSSPILSGSTTITNLLISSTAPTISAGFGTSPSVFSANGTALFEVNVGTGGTAASGAIGLPVAATGWNCFCSDISTFSTTVFMCRQTATTANSVTIGNFTSSAASAAWQGSDVLIVSCLAR